MVSATQHLTYIRITGSLVKMQVPIGESGIFSQAVPMHQAGPQPSPPAARGLGSHGEWKIATRGEATSRAQARTALRHSITGSC